MTMEPRIIKNDDQYRRYLDEVARLAANDPDANTDEGARLELLAKLVEESGMTAILVTHSIEEALLLGDRCVVMTAQPGRIKQMINVPFPHPRDLIALSAAPEFGKLKIDIWRVLEDEVNRARAETEK